MKLSCFPLFLLHLHPQLVHLLACIKWRVYCTDLSNSFIPMNLSSEPYSISPLPERHLLVFTISTHGQFDHLIPIYLKNLTLFSFVGKKITLLIEETLKNLIHTYKEVTTRCTRNCTIEGDHYHNHNVAGMNHHHHQSPFQLCWIS